LSREGTLIDPEIGGQLLDIFGRSSCLSIEECSDGNLATAEFLGNSLERSALLGFGGEESVGGVGELRMLRYLLVLLVILKLAKMWAASTYIKGGKVEVRHDDGALTKRALKERGEDMSRDSCVAC
jgi:hypothetical protein